MPGHVQPHPTARHGGQRGRRVVAGVTVPQTGVSSWTFWSASVAVPSIVPSTYPAPGPRTRCSIWLGGRTIAIAAPTARAAAPTASGLSSIRRCACRLTVSALPPTWPGMLATASPTPETRRPTWSAAVDRNAPGRAAWSDVGCRRPHGRDHRSPRFIEPFGGRVESRDGTQPPDRSAGGFCHRGGQGAPDQAGRGAVARGIGLGRP